MLATPWEQRRKRYDFVIIGSGYGGAITAARLAAADIHPKPTVCILERGKEWTADDFPETLDGVIGATRSDLNPLGLFELLNHPDISVIKGSGLGGTSLINANVAIKPDREVFERFNWPASITFDVLDHYYDIARGVLASAQHPKTLKEPKLAKFKALEVRAAELGIPAESLYINVNFTIKGKNQYGVEQNPCIDCGNCVTGCKVGAKNTLMMNYLPMAKNAGATIFTQAKVEYLEKRPDGTWRIHGKHVNGFQDSDDFTMDAGEIVMAAGSLNTTEILLRSEHKGLSVSPALGTKFSGNGDFFGLAYNSDHETDVLGYLHDQAAVPGLDSPPAGPNIVGLVRYTKDVDETERIAVEDFSFPNAYIDGAKVAFGAIQGVPTVTGNEAAQAARLAIDRDPGSRAHDPNGAMNHSMLYLLMGHDNARGTILFQTPLTEPDGKIAISWDKAGQQQIFTLMNEEIRRHAHALRGNFLENPTFKTFNLKHLITAHPLGGCPMGDDYLQGACDPFGRVFAGDGSVHQGLSVSDGSIVPSALGVNPLLTISAITERFVEKKIAVLKGEDSYPKPAGAVSMAGGVTDALLATDYNEDQLEAVFRRCPTMGIDTLINKGGDPVIDTGQQTIHNDRYWKGFFPKGHVLNAMSAAIFTGFEKRFFLQDGKYAGMTSDTDGRINARNSLKTIEVGHGSDGTLEAGTYILLNYLDPPWQGFYDVFKIINEDLMIGRVYFGKYPHGTRVFTFPMSRLYRFDQMTVADHAALFGAGEAPTAEQLDGVWRMDVISNANHAGGLAYLQFSNKPDGSFQARYQVLGLIEGIVTPAFLQDHFQLTDFTPFHDEIRTVTGDFLVGKYVTQIPAAITEPFGNSSLGLFHSEADGKFGFYYTLSRVAGKDLATNALLRPFLDVQLPDGVGMTFDEEMVGWYWAGEPTPGPGRDGDLTIAARIPATGDPAGAAACKFDGHMTVADVNEFIDGQEHQAAMSGTIHFDNFEDLGNVTFPIDDSTSTFQYLRINPATGEAQMRYHIEFAAPDGRRFTFDGVKYMQRVGPTGPRSIPELLADYTTLYCHVAQVNPDGTKRETGTALLRFRTFEDWAAVGNFAAFLASFTITGNSDPVTQLQARFRFLSFTAQFVIREYDPLGF